MVGECEWLLLLTSLRVVCKGICETKEAFVAICEQWLKSEEPGEWHFDSKDERFGNKLPFLYNAFRASLLQRYLLRFVQRGTGAIVAGSYPAALRILRQNHELMWIPSDIDVWVDERKKLMSSLLPTKHSYQQTVSP